MFYRLTDEEAVQLDGKCRPEIQKDVDAARARLELAATAPDLAPKEAGLIADILRVAKRDGRLIFRHMGIGYCDVCGKSGGYAKYKSGRNRGQDNHSKPLALGGYDFERAFVTIQRRATLGCCDACWEKLRTRIREALADVQAEIPDALLGKPCEWQRFDRAECKACGWKGHEGEMRQLYALMGGKYPGGCPNCPAENLPLGRTLIERSSNDFVVVRRVTTHATDKKGTNAP